MNEQGITLPPNTPYFLPALVCLAQRSDLRKEGRTVTYEGAHISEFYHVIRTNSASQYCSSYNLIAHEKSVHAQIGKFE